jgi:SAM-dependent methyltransferase
VPEQLVSDQELERSAVVANRAMNRTRGLSGRDGYQAALGVDVAALLDGGPKRWLDLCCGSGRALVEAAGTLSSAVELTGVDLVGQFAAPVPAQVRLITASITSWQPADRFDLVTCVHGLHYIGDKLAVLAKAASWLTADGLFVADFDATSIRRPDGKPVGARLTKALRDAGFEYDSRKRRIRRQGHAVARLPFDYLGADGNAGPNYTGQPAVHSYYNDHG